MAWLVTNNTIHSVDLETGAATAAVMIVNDVHFLLAMAAAFVVGAFLALASLARREATARESVGFAPDLFADFNGIEPDQREPFRQRRALGRHHPVRRDRFARIDQLDRHHEIKALGRGWREALAKAGDNGPVVVANACDPLVVWAAQ